jgi:hypothetical protein
MSNVRRHVKKVLVATFLSTWLSAAFAQGAESRLADELKPPSAAAPNSGGVRSAHIGDPLLVVIYYSNPALGADRTADVQCDIKVTRPDGTVSLRKTGVPCLRGHFASGDENLYLPGLVLRFTGEPVDPKGEWSVNASLRDMVRGTEIALKTSFTLN